MIRRNIKTEIKKALCNRMALITLLLVTGLLLYHSYTAVWYYQRALKYYQAGDYLGNPILSANSLFNSWLGADSGSFGSSCFYFLLPMIAVLPYGWSLAGEMKTGYTQNVLARVSRKSYLLSKYVGVFVSGALAVMIPLLCSVVLLAAFIPALLIEIQYPFGVVWQTNMWYGIFYSHPWLYIGLYICLNGLFAGLIAELSMACAFFARSRVAVLIVPFLLLTVWDYIDTTYFPVGEYSPIRFLTAIPASGVRYGWAVALCGAILFGVAAAVVAIKGKTYETL